MKPIRITYTYTHYTQIVIKHIQIYILYIFNALIQVRISIKHNTLLLDDKNMICCMYIIQYTRIHIGI